MSVIVSCYKRNVQTIAFKTISHDAVPPNLQRPNREIQWYVEEHVETHVC